MTAKRCIHRVLLVILMVFLFCGSATLAAEKPADLVPEDALFFVQVENVDQLIEKFKKTSTWGLYKEEALQLKIPVKDCQAPPREPSSRKAFP